MSVNGVTNVGSGDAYASYATGKANKAADTTNKAETKTENASNTTATTNDSGVVYEKSSTGKYTQNTELIAKLKADMAEKTAQLQNIVTQMLSKQGTAYGQANDMWSFLSDGNFTVDEATKTKAQADISEDGYWGVNQTSDRILDFAQALTGGDPDKIKEMRSAFEQGFKDATSTWGKDLPSLSKDTYDAVMKKFDEWESGANGTKETNASTTTVTDPNIA